MKQWISGHKSYTPTHLVLDTYKQIKIGNLKIIGCGSVKVTLSYQKIETNFTRDSFWHQNDHN